jgi:hypothetical protein
MKHIIEFEPYTLRVDGEDHPAVVVKYVEEPTKRPWSRLHFDADGTLRDVEPASLTDEATLTTRFYAERRALEEIRRRSIELAFELAESTLTGSPSNEGKG